MIKLIQKLDLKVLEKVANIKSSFLDQIMVFITKLGNNGFIWIAISVPFLINKKHRLYGIKIILALILTAFIGEFIIKRIVGRIRPSGNIHPDDLLIKNPKSYSFPSGHTSSSIASASILLFSYGLIILPIFILAILIAFSRIYLKVHYLSDVLAGAFLGLTCGTFIHFIIST